MSATHGYDSDGFLAEFFPDETDRREVETGAARLVAENRAHRLAEVRQERVSAIERANVDASELRTLAAYVKALGGRMEIIADFGGERLVIG
jgi:hypothetical protein